ncbi:endonuclease/exonuclease/phosphatase family protein [Microbacterium awajiense]|uniref:Endonuclease/exonuclease/phosphatase family protein n=1 Tax=Microbacterium awajiense TaxID=415214 RepID=A0ABP7AA76_9MICO
MLRKSGILVALLCAIGAAVLTWPSFFRVDRLSPIAQIISFRPLVALAFAGLAMVALLIALVPPLRRGALAVTLVFIVAAAANGTIILSRGVTADELPDKTATSIRVMTWNTAGSATDPDTVARIAVAMDADIVTLPETTIETGEQVALAMRDLGHRMWAHHAEYGTDGWDARSTTLLISPRLGEYSVIRSSQDGSSNTSTVPSAVAMPVSGDGPIVVAAHAVAPRPSYMQHWRDDLQWLADQCGGADVIMAGDFNATVDHMGGLGVDGGDLGLCHDAAVETGGGSVGTWTTALPALLGAPIDHVMASSHWEATGSIVLRADGGSESDHRPLVVQLEPVSP